MLFNETNGNLYLLKIRTPGVNNSKFEDSSKTELTSSYVMRGPHIHNRLTSRTVTTLIQIVYTSFNFRKDRKVKDKDGQQNKHGFASC